MYIYIILTSTCTYNTSIYIYIVAKDIFSYYYINKQTKTLTLKKIKSLNYSFIVTKKLN